MPSKPQSLELNLKRKTNRIKDISNTQLKKFFNQKYNPNNTNNTNNEFNTFKDWFKGYISRKTSKIDYSNSTSNAHFLNKSITKYFGVINNKITKVNRKIKAKTGYFIPWILVKFKNQKTYNNLKINKNIIIPGIKKNWLLNYNNNPFNFPSVRLLPRKNNIKNTLNSVHIGDICKTNRENENYKNTCGLKTNGFGIYTTTTNKFRILKRNMRGLSIGAIEKILKRKVGLYNISTKPSLMAEIIELKRNGDYGQIAVCEKLNTDNDVHILEPFDRDILVLVKQIITRQGALKIVTEEIKKKLLEKTLNKDFFYDKAVYYSNDRPACFSCLIKNIPYMFRPTGNGNIYGNFNKFNIEYKTDATIKLNPTNASLIVHDLIYNDGNGKKLAIMDTFHDFTIGTKKGNWTKLAEKTHITKLKYIMYKAAGENYKDFINLFDSISVKKNVEDIMGEILKKYSTPYIDEKVALKALKAFEKSNRYCIIHDAGVLRSFEGDDLSDRRAMTPARIFDPATAKLTTNIQTKYAINNKNIPKDSTIIPQMYLNNNNININNNNV